MAKKDNPDEFYETLDGVYPPRDRKRLVKRNPEPPAEEKIEYIQRTPKKVVEEPSYEKENEEEWIGKSNEVLRKRGSPFRVVNTRRYFIAIILLIIIGMVGFSYFTLTDKFKPTLVDNSTCIMPDIPACPSCPNNTCNCPAPNLNFSISTPTVNVVCENSTG